MNPTDAWTRRELTLTLCDQRRWDESLAEAEVAIALDPTNTFGYSCRAQTLERAGRLDQARADYRRAIELSVENEFAIHSLLRLAVNHAQRVAELDFVHAQIVAQTLYGSGLFAYFDCATGTLAPDVLLAQLRAAHQARPDLWHTWSVLIQGLRNQDPQQALELADRACQKFPLLPGAWLDLATVRRGQGDGDAEVAALEQALAINPVWTAPLYRLAEIYDQRRDYLQAKARLEQALRSVPTDAVLQGHLADALWQLGERDAALARLEHLVRLEPGYDWAWWALGAWGAEFDRPTAALDAARDLTARRPAEARSWLVLARILDPQQDTAERLAALDKALELSPRLIEAHRLRSDTFIAQRQFDEALAACRPTHWGPDLPAQLRAHEAEVLMAQEGRRAEAVQHLVAVLDDNPDYLFGWRRLADWTDETDDVELHRRAAEALVRLDPQDAMSWRHRGDARRRQQDAAGAKQDFAAALALAPRYEYVANWLFDLHADDGQWDDARRVLDGILQGEPSEYALARAVRLKVHEKDPAGAIEVCRQLWRAATAAEWPRTATVSLLLEARWIMAYDEALGQAIAAGAAGPQAPLYRVEPWVQLQRWGEALTRLEQIPNRDAAWHAALTYVLERLHPMSTVAAIRPLVRKHGDVLRASTESWGTTGTCLMDTEVLPQVRARQALKWFADWRSRDDLQAWIVSNIGQCLIYVRDYRQAADALRHALSLPADHTQAKIHAYLAAAEAALGNWQAAGQMASACDQATGQLTDEGRALRALAAASTMLHENWPTSGRFRGLAAAKELRFKLYGHRKAIRGNRQVLLLYYRVLYQLANAHGARLLAWYGWLQS